MATTLTTAEMVKAVRDHASKNYNKGWDVVVECYSDKDIEDELGGSKTAAGAIAKIAVFVNLNKEMQSNCW